ncbi:hypothetical protein NQ317_004552 [Molorchus minor]|uniref:cellulase n=1 Tax=Molorchus minor TaxID=1323400 RepID=A0ABQ9JKT4_9CUCU|nr:hypothetical protein NQ317_004552 [Molorchus minor]
MKFLIVLTALVASFGASLGDIDYTNENIAIEVVSGGVSGSGYNTGYWDCCKPSCAWIGNSLTESPVRGCAIDGVTTIDIEEQSGCGSGGSYMCTDQNPYAANATFAYGFTAASFVGGTDYSMCCRCLLLEWIHDETGRQFVVQVTNTGGDLLNNQFDLGIPGTGVGYQTQGCVKQWNAPETGWGEQYGGLSSEDQCVEMPEALQPGCRFKFEWMWHNLPDNQLTFTEVVCPKQITDISGCVVTD